MQLDTSEAQAVYLANSYTESWQLRKFKAEADPAVVGKFMGRGALQVTFRQNYIKTLAYLEARAAQLDVEGKTDPQAAKDATQAHAAAEAIKANPAAAEDPKYAMLFSSAFMHAAGHGGVKSVADLSGGVDPKFAGNGPEDTWMTGNEDIAGNIVKWTQKRDELAALVPTLPAGDQRKQTEDKLSFATAKAAYWNGVKQAAARKDAAYDRAMQRLKPKAWNPQPGAAAPGAAAQP